MQGIKQWKQLLCPFDSIAMANSVIAVDCCLYIFCKVVSCGAMASLMLFLCYAEADTVASPAPLVTT